MAEVVVGQEREVESERVWIIGMGLYESGERLRSVERTADEVPGIGEEVAGR
jgi:hypothetical protein